jgi:hypothetical protein
MHADPKTQPHWTVLPPLPLHGLGSAMVESLAHYVRRIAWISGISASRLMAYSGTGPLGKSAHEEATASRDLTLGRPEGRVLTLERLTGVEQLRYGTFWVLKNVAGPLFLGRPISHRRWCPECYAEWDPEQSYEPLIWSIGLLSCCPKHRCRLEDRCASCGALQPAGISLEHRRCCVQCKRRLVDVRDPVELSARDAWIDQQLCQLVELCSTVGQESFPEETYPTYIKELLAQAMGYENLPVSLQSTVRLQSGNGSIRKPSLRAMLRMCALQGVSVCDMLWAPREAASVPLIDLWNDHAAPSLRDELRNEKPGIAQDLLVSLLRRCRACYLPPMDVVLSELGISRALVRDANVELYERYEARYREQAGTVAKIRLADAFQIALRDVADIPLHRLRRGILWDKPEPIAKAAHISQDEAASVFFSALIYSRLGRRAQVRLASAGQKSPRIE